MTPRIPPTTSIDLDRTDPSPCCGADLVMSSPPDGYECRECMTGYDVSDRAPADADADGDESKGDTTSEDAETCETVMGSGEVCGRELPCPYHD